jgi:hypothetical protein
MATILEGEQQWQQFGSAGPTEFYNYYCRDRKHGYLPFSARMNCWEIILYAALQAGQITEDDIIKFCKKAFPDFFPPQPWEALNWLKPLVYVPGFSIAGGVTREPEPGDLLFFTRKDKSTPDHVAVSMGGRQAVSLSTRPYTTTQRVTIDQLYFDRPGDAFIQVGISITQVIQRLYFY